MSLPTHTAWPLVVRLHGNVLEVKECVTLRCEGLYKGRACNRRLGDYAVIIGTIVCPKCGTPNTVCRIGVLELDHVSLTLNAETEPLPKTA
jgi:hypothetical protein